MQQVEPSLEPTPAPAHGSHWWGILRHIGLFLLMIVWAVCGLAYTDIYPDNSIMFWQVTTVVFAVIAVIRVYHEGGPGRHVLALKQVAHWGAFLVAMILLHIHFVTDLVSGDLLGIAMMTLLALATFLDGVYVDWRFCIVGAVLGCGVVLLAMVDDAALGLALMGVVALVLLYLLRHVSFRRHAAEL